MSFGIFANLTSDDVKQGVALDKVARDLRGSFDGGKGRGL